MTRSRADLQVRVDGVAHGPPLLLCNSLGTDLRMWDPQVELLGRRFRTVRFDLPGHGGAASPPGEYTLDDLGGDAEAVLDELALGEADVCGESLGGVVALWLAIRRPQRVRRVVLANTAARVGTAESWQARIDAVRAGGMGAVAELVLQRFFSDDFRRRSPDRVAAFRHMLEDTDAAGYAACCAALRDADLRGFAAEVRASVLVVAGAQDIATPVSDSRWLHEHIADSRMEILDAAHLGAVERPQEFSRLVDEFLV